MFDPFKQVFSDDGRLRMRNSQHYLRVELEMRSDTGMSCPMNDQSA